MQDLWRQIQFIRISIVPARPARSLKQQMSHAPLLTLWAIKWCWITTDHLCIKTREVTVEWQTRQIKSMDSKKNPTNTTPRSKRRLLRRTPTYRSINTIPTMMTMILILSTTTKINRSRYPINPQVKPLASLTRRARRHLKPKNKHRCQRRIDSSKNFKSRLIQTMRVDHQCQLQAEAKSLKRLHQPQSSQILSSLKKSKTRRRFRMTIIERMPLTNSMVAIMGNLVVENVTRQDYPVNSRSPHKRCWRPTSNECTRAISLAMQAYRKPFPQPNPTRPRSPTVTTILIALRTRSWQLRIPLTLLPVVVMHLLSMMIEETHIVWPQCLWTQMSRQTQFQQPMLNITTLKVMAR